jgi:hypothetical protein
MIRKNLILSVLAGLLAVVGVAGCSSPADTASANLSKAADNFEIQRRIVFINGITDKYLMVVEGRCSLGNFDAERELTVTCKIGPNEYKKHFLGLSDNVTYFVEQLESANVGEWHYRVNFRPETLVPDIQR